MGTRGPISQLLTRLWIIYYVSLGAAAEYMKRTQACFCASPGFEVDVQRVSCYNGHTFQANSSSSRPSVPSCCQHPVRTAVTQVPYLFQGSQMRSARGSEVWYGRRCYASSIELLFTIRVDAFTSSGAASWQFQSIGGT